jgi:hypothetical protein
MSFAEVPLTTNSSNFPLISPSISLTTNVMLLQKVITCNQPKLLILSFGSINSLIGGSKGRTIVPLMAIESSMVQFESPLS